MFRKVKGNVEKFQKLGPNRVINVTKTNIATRNKKLSNQEKIDEARRQTFAALKNAYEDEVKYLIIKHGKSPSKRGLVTIGSRVRSLMRSHSTGPYILRTSCIEHESAFIAAIRPKSSSSKMAGNS